MKFPYSSLTAICLSFSAFAFTAHAELSPVHMRIETNNKNSVDKTSSTQSRSLNVILDNSSSEQVDVKVKYVIFGRDASSKDIVTVGQGEMPATIKPHGTEKVSTPEAKATYKKGDGLDSIYGSMAIGNKFNLDNKVYKVSQKPESYLYPGIVAALK